MGEKGSDVVLHGMWFSGPCNRVVLALKAKGIPYELVEEDLSNKSDALLRHNPVHKKVPVLVHGGKAVAESLIILEYIDETWSDSGAPMLLPQDPYLRAKARFWVKYYEEKILAAFMAMVVSKGEEREKVIRDMNETIKVFQEGVERDFPGKSPYYNGETLGLLDIVVGVSACTCEAVHEAFGVLILSPEKNTPEAFIDRVNALKEHPLVKETLPPHDQLVTALKEKFSTTPNSDA